MTARRSTHSSHQEDGVMGEQAQYRRQCIAGARRMADSIIAMRSAPGFEQSADHPNVVSHLHRYSAAAFRLAEAAQKHAQAVTP